MRYIHRQIEPLLTQLIGQFPSVAVTGPRQCGKSTLLQTLLSKTHAYVTFDDPTTREQAIADPQFFLDSIGERVILDEIQYVPQLLSYVKIAIDSDRRHMGRFIFTGSQQFTMIKDLGDSLAGRIALLELLPFHTEEQQSVKRLHKRLAKPLEAFVHACLVGGYPEVNTLHPLNLKTWYGSYLQTYLERDIRTLYNIGNLRTFQQFMQLLAARCTQILNMTSLSRDLGVSVNTIKNWLSILEASRIIYLLPPYHQNLGKRITKSPKIYFLDCGLVCFLTGIEAKAHLLKGPMGGALFENFCVQETIKTFFFKGIRPRIYFLRTHNGLEIDLLIEGKNSKLHPCEIKLTQTPRLHMGRPIRQFTSLFSKLDVRQGRILCLSEKPLALSKEIQVQPLSDYWPWLKTLR